MKRLKLICGLSGSALGIIAFAGTFMLVKGSLLGLGVLAAAVIAVVIVSRIFEETILNSP
jgi:hypothetical protein